MADEKQLPTINHRKQIAKSNLFAIEQIDLTFANGEQRQYERMMGTNRGAVMIVPMIDDDTLLLVKEYCAGTHSYILGFPKGLIDEGEQPKQAANRELQEEVGFASEHLHQISEVMMAPAFFNAKMTIFLATNLHASSLEGDEPEPLEIVHWPINDYKALLAKNDFTEARSIAALMLVRDFLEQTSSSSETK